MSFAVRTTTARVEERCRELKCGTVDSLGGAQRAFANRSLRVNRNAELSVLFFGAILFAYTTFVYMVVDRYGDRVLAPTTASKVEQVLQ